MKKLVVKAVVIEKIQGDDLTPISIYQRISGKKKFLLESSLKHSDSGRYSFIGGDPTFEVKGTSGKTMLTYPDKTEIIYDNPIEVLNAIMPDVNQSVPEELPFIGGSVGFVGYGVLRHYENIRPCREEEGSLPHVHLMLYEDLIVYDHLLQEVHLVAIQFQGYTSEVELRTRLSKRKEELLKEYKAKKSSYELGSFKAEITKENFIEAVKKAKEYILQGDVFQVVLSQKMKASLQGDAFSYYRSLRIKNPSPYMYYIDFQDYIVLGTSPESLIKISERRVITNPIAGTRPRGRTIEEDRLLARQLMKDEKEIAEHNMLVDLSRNDLGRVCEFGSIDVDKYMELEKYSHVMHLVSEVSGILHSSSNPLEALLSCVPAGTVSGAPKLRAMEIIEELEATTRGVYAGAIGYLSFDGSMDFALTIRTMVIQNEIATIQAGAGIVYDSIPEKEYEETLHKLHVFLGGNDDSTH